MLTRSDLDPYQQEMIDFMRRKRAWAVWAVMGAGKTVSALTAISDLQDHLFSVHALVVAPLRVANSVWPAEAAKWAHLRHLRVSLATGNERNRRLALNTEADVYVINRENVPWLVDYVGVKTWPFDTVILDESSSFKSHESNRWKAMRKVRKYISRIGELTGTPASEGYINLWAQAFLLDQGRRLGKTVTGYRNRWFESDYMGYKYTPRLGAEEEIRSRLRDVVMIVERYDGLPGTREISVPVTFSARQLSAYKEFEREKLLELMEAGIEIEAVTAAALTNKLLQYAQGAVYDDEKRYHVVHDLKIQALRDIVEDQNGASVLVAYTFKSDLDRLQKAFPEARTLDRAGVAEAAWNRGEVPMLLVHPQSAGHGLNLQAGGSTVVWFGLNWSLELHDQLNARLARKGQRDAKVFIHYLVMTNTMDEAVMEALKTKGHTQQTLIASLKRLIAETREDEIVT